MRLIQKIQKSGIILAAIGFCQASIRRLQTPDWDPISPTTSRDLPESCLTGGLCDIPCAESLRASSQPLDRENQSPSEAMAIICRPVGLPNLGDTCYANSVLQAWMHDPAWLSQYQTRSHRSNCAECRKQLPCLSGTFEALVMDIWQAQANHCASLSAGCMSDLFQRLSPRFPLDIPHDAGEYWMYLVSQIEALSNHFSRESVWSSRCGCCGAQGSSKTSKNLSCLLYPSSNSRPKTLVQAIGEQIRTGEQPHVQVCDACGATGMAYRLTGFTAPKALHIQIFHFPGLISINFAPIPHQFHFNLPGIAHPQAAYRLQSTIAFRGQRDTQGHYRAAVRIHDRWYQCDDMDIQAIPEQEVLQCSSELVQLTYTRCDDGGSVFTDRQP